MFLIRFLTIQESRRESEKYNYVVMATSADKHSEINCPICLERLSLPKKMLSMLLMFFLFFFDKIRCQVEHILVLAEQMRNKLFAEFYDQEYTCRI